MSNCILSNEVLKLEKIGNKVIFSQYFSNLSPKEYERVIQINFIYLLNGFKAKAPKKLGSNRSLLSIDSALIGGNNIQAFNAYNTKPDENGNLTITFSIEGPKEGT